MNPPLESADAASDSNSKPKAARPFLTSYWFEIDRILCGDHPLAIPGLEEPDAIAALLQGGFRVFVDFSEEGEMPSYSELALKIAMGHGIDPAELSFHRLRMLRGRFPQNSNHLRKIFRLIRLARVSGKKVYLHCAKGHGRTGTVAGCLYREIFKFAPTSALGQLSISLRDYGNRDGRDFGSELRFGETPETSEQSTFVLEWNPHQSINHHEVTGGILGAAAAEAFAVPSSLPRGMWAFHESMIRAMIDGLYRPGSYGQTWTEMLLNPTPLEDRLASRRNPVEESPPPEEESFFCLLPCLLPFALARGNCADLIDRVTDAISRARSLELSDDGSRFCAIFYCLVVSDLAHGSSVAKASQFAWDAMAGRPESCLVSAIVAELLDPHTLFDKAKSAMASPGNIAEILAAALWSIHHAEDYTTAVNQSMGLGGESVTLASLVGGLAGIIHGEASIPKAWRSGIRSTSYLGVRTEEFRSFVGEENCIRLNDIPHY